MNSFKKYQKPACRVLGCLIFWGIGLFLLARISFMLCPDEEGNYRTVFPVLYSEEKNSLDVVAVGSSAVFRYVNNPWLWNTRGITSYNVAVGTMPLEPMTYVLDEVRKTQSPQVWLIETRSYMTYEEKKKGWKIFLHRVTDGMDYSWNRTKLIFECVKYPNRLLEFLFPIVAYHDEWEHLDKYRWYNSDNRRELRQKGWKNRLKIKEQEELPSFPDAEALPLDEVSETELRKLLDYCRREELPVVFFRSPYVQTEEEAGRAKTIGNIIKEYGIEFWDLNLYMEEIGLDPKTDFYNAGHVNAAGARKVTTWLADTVLERYTQVRRHSEAVTESWDRAASRENKVVSEFLAELSAENRGRENGDK